MKTIASALQERIDKKVSERMTHDSSWQDIADYVYPGVAFNTEFMPGEKRNTRIYDTTALHANEQLAGSLHSLLTSPATRWFALSVGAAKTRLGNKERRWLDDTAEKMYSMFNSERSGFNSAVHEMYMSLGAFGCACFYEEYSPKDNIIRFRSFALRDIYIDEDNDGVVNTIYRRVQAPGAVLVQKLGNRAPESLIKKAAKNPFDTCTMWHVVEPNGMYDVQPESNLPFISAYVYPDEKKVVSTGGYTSFPYQFPRWSKRSGEVYGFGPGGSSYPDVKMLQRMKEVAIRGAEKQIDPPLLVPNDSVIGPIVINPGGIINYNPNSTDSGIRPLEMNSRPQLADAQIATVQQQVLEGFYVKWMNLPQRGPQMTATEILQRRDEALRLLSPMLSRMNSEFTGPLIERVFELGLRHGLLDPPPDSLVGADMKIEYLSPIAQAQRMTELESVNRSLQMGMALAEVDPSVMINFDLDAIVQGTSTEINKMPARYMRSAQDVQQIKQAQAQAQQAQAQAEMQNTQAQAAKAGTQAQKNAAQAGAM